MSSMSSITNEVQHFQSSVKKLSTDIKEAEVNWSDEKYQALSKMVSQIASNSKGVMIAADRLSSDVKKFESVVAKN